MIAAATMESTPTMPTETRQFVTSATIPAMGTPATLAIVFMPMTAAIARPRSRNGNVSATVAFTFGKMTALPMPEHTRAATMSPRLGAKAAATVESPMIAGPSTRNGLRPIRSEYGPARTATAIPGAPYAATTRPAVPVETPNSRASGSRIGLITRPL